MCAITGEPAAGKASHRLSHSQDSGSCVVVIFLEFPSEAKPHTPEPHTPEPHTPELHTPESHTPELHTPEPHTPELHTSELHTPELHTPEPHTPELHTPELQDLSSDVAAGYESGIMLGAPQFVVLSRRQLQDIRHWISILDPGKEIPEHLPSTANSYPRIWKISDYDLGTVFRKEEYVLLSDYDQPKVWLMQISNFLVYGPIFNKCYQFIDGSYFVAKTVHGEVIRDEWSKQPWMVRRHFERLRVQPMKLLCLHTPEPRTPELHTPEPNTPELYDVSKLHEKVPPV